MSWWGKLIWNVGHAHAVNGRKQLWELPFWFPETRQKTISGTTWSLTTTRRISSTTMEVHQQKTDSTYACCAGWVCSRENVKRYCSWQQSEDPWRNEKHKCFYHSVCFSCLAQTSFALRCMIPSIELDQMQQLVRTIAFSISICSSGDVHQEHQQTWSRSDGHHVRGSQKVFAWYMQASRKASFTMNKEAYQSSKKGASTVWSEDIPESHCWKDCKSWESRWHQERFPNLTVILEMHSQMWRSQISRYTRFVSWLQWPKNDFVFLLPRMEKSFV